MKSNISRRKFLGTVSLGGGAFSMAGDEAGESSRRPNKLSRHVNIGTVALMNLSAKSPQDMVQQVLQVMEEMITYRPDIICLPEIFAYSHIAGYRYDIREVAEKTPGAIVTPFMNFADRHNCYIICPTYVLHEGNVYISAVLIDRQGKIAGEYHKLRPAEGELEMGIKPGKFPPPVFQTDFGKIGIQICFDIKYEEGWNYLKDNGAQIIFWPSAYAAGQEISSRAWRHQIYIVTSTQKDTSKICDITGETIAQTGRWQGNWVCAPVNLEKAFIHTWPAVSKFPAMRKKYGSRIGIRSYTEEEWTIIESLDPDLKIDDVLKAFNLKSMHDFLKELGIAHGLNGKRASGAG